jgi:hypothetical protein
MILLLREEEEPVALYRELRLVVERERHLLIEQM